MADNQGGSTSTLALLRAITARRVANGEQERIVSRARARDTEASFISNPRLPVGMQEAEMEDGEGESAQTLDEQMVKLGEGGPARIPQEEYELPARPVAPVVSRGKRLHILTKVSFELRDGDLNKKITTAQLAVHSSVDMGLTHSSAMGFITRLSKEQKIALGLVTKK